MRNALSLVPKAAQQMVGATIRTVFAQPDAVSAHQQWRRVSEGFRHRFPRLAELMDEAEEDVLSYAAFPAEHWQKIWSNNPLERVNKEVKRRTNVVGIFPTEGSVIRLVGSILSVSSTTSGRSANVISAPDPWRSWIEGRSSWPNSRNW